jgi:hypothetical protein
VNPVEATVFSALRAPDRLRLLRLHAHRRGVQVSLMQLERILASTAFARVQERTKQFLAFILGMKLLGREDQIKETTIAIAVYGAPTDYNSAETSRIRVAAADLRRRLQRYVESEGCGDDVQITIPLNTYVPVLTPRPLTVAVGPFDNWNNFDGREHFGKALVEELVARVPCPAQLVAKAWSPNDSPSDYRLWGCYVYSGGQMKLHVVLLDVRAGRTMFWGGFRHVSDEAYALARPLLKVMRANTARRLMACD